MFLHAVSKRLSTLGRHTNNSLEKYCIIIALCALEIHICIIRVCQLALDGFELKPYKNICTALAIEYYLYMYYNCLSAIVVSQETYHMDWLLSIFSYSLLTVLVL